MEETTSTTPRSYITQPAAPKERHTVTIVLLTLFVGAPALLFWGCALIVLFVVGSFSSRTDEDRTCTVAHIPLQGVVTTGGGIASLLDIGGVTRADDFVADVHAADVDETIDAILVDVDSPGGTPVAADEMMRALQEAHKPVVAVIRELGASAAYWAASGADYIVASPVSEVGSVGVTMSYLETASSSDRAGSRWIDLSSGAFKDAGNPERVLREEEQTFYREQVQAVHTYMVDRITQARGALSHEELAALADGRVYVGTQALALKLIDALGSFDEALAWVDQATGHASGSMTLCEVKGRGLGALL